MNPYTKYKLDLLYPDEVSGISCNVIRKYTVNDKYGKVKEHYFKKYNKDESFAGWYYSLGRKIGINSEGNIANK